MKSLTLITGLCLTLTSISSFAAKPEAEIRLSFSDKNPRVVKVEVKWQAESPYIRVADSGAEQFKDGWAHFIKDVSLKDAQNQPLTANFDGKNKWSTNAKPGQQVTLRYTVDMSHDQHSWPHGTLGPDLRLDRALRRCADSPCGWLDI